MLHVLQKALVPLARLQANGPEEESPKENIPLAIDITATGTVMVRQVIGNGGEDLHRQARDRIFHGCYV